MSAARYRLGLGRRAVNRIVRALLRLGWGPAAYLLVWLVAPYGEVAWVRNLRSAGLTTLSRGRRVEEISVREIGVDDAAPVLRMYVRRVPITRAYFDAGPESDLDAFRAEAPQHPVFAVIPTPHGTARA